MNQFIRLCCVLILGGYSFLSFAESASFDLKITGFNRNVGLNAEIKIYTGPDSAADSISLENRKRDRNGHFILKGHKLDVEIDNVSEMYIIGKIIDLDGKLKGYIPLTVIHKSEFNRRGYTSIKVSSYSDKKNSFSNSYPFSKGFNRYFINESNLEKVLFSTRLLMELGYVNGDDWQILFNSFLQNVQFFRNNTKYINRVFSYLNTYGHLTENPEYYKFYAEMLVKLDKLEIDGTDVAPGESLRQRIQKEWETLVIDHIVSITPIVRSMIDVLYSEKRYLECVQFSGRAFKKFQTDEVVEKFVNTEFRNYVLSAMQGGTECFQMDFADRAKNGNKNDVRAAALFEKDDAETKDAVGGFIDLFRVLEKGGYLPRRPIDMPTDEASRIEELDKYYRELTAK